MFNDLTPILNVDTGAVVSVYTIRLTVFRCRLELIEDARADPGSAYCSRLDQTSSSRLRVDFSWQPYITSADHIRPRTWFWPFWLARPHGGQSEVLWEC